MTKEELKQEAEEYVKNNYCETCVMAEDCEQGCIDCYTVRAYLASAEPREKRIAELEKENAELQKKIRCECTRCVYSDSPCIRSDYGVENDEDVCPNYKNVFVAYTQLKEENAELNNFIMQSKKDGISPINALIIKNLGNQLIKAKELLKQFLKAKNSEDTYKAEWEAEQFLKDREVEK
jgi:hypothetical protein